MSDSNDESMDIDVNRHSPKTSRKTNDLYKPYDKEDRYNRHNPRNESPSRIIRLLSQFPPSKSRFEESSQRSPPMMTRLFSSNNNVSTRPIPLPEQALKPKTYTRIESDMKPTSTLKFSLDDYHRAVDNDKKLNINFFRRKHRHIDDVDETLSPISYRSTKSFSRFDRLFESRQQEEKRTSVVVDVDVDDEVMSQATQDMLSHYSSAYGIDTPERLLLQQDDEIFSMNQEKERKVQARLNDESRKEEHNTVIQHPLFKDINIPSQEETKDDIVLPSTCEFRSPIKEEEEEEKRQDNEPPTLEEEIQLPIVDTQDMLDDYDYYGGGDFEEVEEVEEVEEEENEENEENEEEETSIAEENESRMIESRKRMIVPGDSFIRKLLNDTIEPSRDILTNTKVKQLFDSRLNHEKNTRVGAHHFQKITTLFFNQLVDDLLSYKNNQAAEDQDEISDKDMILLMQRQRLISDKSSLEALAHKFLPREYSDLVCQSALAYNQLYPSSDQELSGDDED